MGGAAISEASLAKHLTPHCNVTVLGESNRMDLNTIGRLSMLLLFCGLGASVTMAQSDAASVSDVPYSKKGADTCIACHDDEKSLAVFPQKRLAWLRGRAPAPS